MGMSSSRLSMLLAAGTLCLGLAATAPAQTTSTTDVRNFEVLMVDGDRLVVRDQKGTHEYTVPADFRFTVDGKALAVNDLKAGMKGTATLTTTTTVQPVVVTEVKEAQVLQASELSMVVREGDKVQRYTQGQFDKRGVQIYKDGRPIRMADLRRGDALTAVVVTQGAPVVLTAQEVQATLDQEKAASQPAATPAPAPAAPPAQVAAADTKAAAPTTMAPAPAVPARPVESSGFGVPWWLVLVVLALIVLFIFMRRRPGS